MEQAIRHDELDAALSGCGAAWDAAQTHGLLAGRIAIAGSEAGFEWLSQVLEGADTDGSSRGECEAMLSTLFAATYQQLSERQSEFEPLLPDDDESTTVRAAALGHWCEGFLHGLVSSTYGEALKEHLAADPLADIIKDMLQITRAMAEDDGDHEADEQAYAELVEYLRVAAQLTYEELVELRRGPAETAGADMPRGVLH
ncbi:MAG: UPF0149 family protein [Gammaproteobacteria bacterium]|nr:UPF0149 family protein [Gammaproteobacteria bacterium]